MEVQQPQNTMAEVCLASWMTLRTGESQEVGVGCLIICCFRLGNIFVDIVQTFRLSELSPHRRCKTNDCTQFKFVMMVFMNDLEDQNVSEGVGEDKEHMSVQCCNILLFDVFF